MLHLRQSSLTDLLGATETADITGLATEYSEMKKRRSDNEIMIDVLEEAARRSHSDEPFVPKQYGASELPIVLDLIEEKKVRGVVTSHGGAKNITLQGITLPGRQLRDELVSQRDAKKFSSRIKKAGWAALGAIGALVFEYVKKKIGAN